jgi:AtzE family amidohydrolase
MRVLADKVRAGQASAVAGIEQTLERIARLDPALNCFTAILAGRALETAAEIDRKVAAGIDPGPLAGVPFGVKNLYDIAGHVTLAGSIILRDRPPAVADAAMVARLEAAGAILVGALNMDEFAYGFSTENAHYGATRNPHDPERIAGGSSGGSAAVVASGMLPLTLGSDTNGSVRVPASLCGVFGMKPSFGRLSRQGVYPFVDSLDHVGFFAGSVTDLAAAYDVMQDRGSASPAEPALAQGSEGLRVAILGGWFTRHAGPGVLDAVEQVAAALGNVARVELPNSDVARAAAFCITAAEGGNLHLANLRERPMDFDPATRARFIAGTVLPASVVVQAQRFRRWYREQALRLFEHHDVLIAPATICSAPRIGEATVCHDGETLPVRANLGLYTQPISFIGLPVVTVPVARDGLPLGVQLIAAPGREDLALRLAAGLEARGVVAARIAPEPSIRVEEAVS